MLGDKGMLGNNGTLGDKGMLGEGRPDGFSSACVTHDAMMPLRTAE